MSRTTDVMNDALMEMRRLRHENEILAAKVAVLDVFALALQPRESHAQQMRVDPIWDLQRHMEELIQSEKVTGRLSPKQAHEAMMGTMGADKP